MRVLGWIRVGFKSWRVQGNEDGGLVDEVVGVKKGPVVDGPELLVAGVVEDVATLVEEADRSTAVEVDAGARLDS